MGAWIETVLSRYLSGVYIVAPYVGAWIETQKKQDPHEKEKVAPYVGAWIETGNVSSDNMFDGSLPTWERGLKQ